MNLTEHTHTLMSLAHLEAHSIDLIYTAPPLEIFYGTAGIFLSSCESVRQFLPIAREFARILKPSGSLFLEVEGTWLPGRPVRSSFPYELLLSLCTSKEEEGCGFLLAQDLYRYHPTHLPCALEWIVTNPIRLKEAVNVVWWLSTQPNPKANNRCVLQPYSKAQRNLMRKGYTPKKRPSEHNISRHFVKDNGGAIPPNIISMPGERMGDTIQIALKSARQASEEDACLAHFLTFIISLCTDKEDRVFDPFPRSGVSQQVTEAMGRQWVQVATNTTYDPAHSSARQVQTQEAPGSASSFSLS
jgi:hypothetical protein